MIQEYCKYQLINDLLIKDHLNHVQVSNDIILCLYSPGINQCGLNFQSELYRDSVSKTIDDKRMTSEEK